MSLVIQYLVKLSISLGAVWLFYHFILRKLTFYNSNRWYLLGYTLLSFFIPFVNISSLIENRPNDIIRFVPSVHQYTIALEEATYCPVPIWSTQYDKWDFIAFGLIIVAAVLFLRFATSFLSFLNIRRKAKLISTDGVKIYQVDDNIIPFSFGNSIFINSALHSESELQEIVRHEFVHVRQKHTIDIVWAELLCIINWYNPFAWLLKRSIRQNLEFIADNKVLNNGIDKKQYQYLLLKVIGNRQFSIATKFNFSSLKKRIVMMNKTKSAKRQLGRFLFLVPVLAIILLSFRHSFRQTSAEGPAKPVLTDTIPDITVVNSKGYFIDIKDDNGNCTVVVKDKSKKEVKRVLLTEWNAKDDYYENLYGEILPAELPTVEQWMKASNPEIKTITIKDKVATVILKNGKTEVYTLSIKDQKNAFEERCGIKEVAIASTVPVELMADIKNISVNDKTATVTLRNGKTEVYTLSIKEEEEAFKERVGIVNEVAIASTVPVEVTNPVNSLNEVNVVNETIADDFEINGNKAVMKMRNGKVEEYNLADPKEKAAFEKKFGKVYTPALTKTGVYSVVADESAESSLSTTVIVAPTKEGPLLTEGRAVTVIDDADAITIEPDILLTITQKTTELELKSIQASLKMKGFELSFDDIEFRDGKLVKISGTIKSRDGKSTANFVGVDFNKIIISQVKKGDETYFRIDEVVKKKGVS